MKALTENQLSEVYGGSYTHNLKWIGMGAGFCAGPVVGVGVANFANAFGTIVGALAGSGVAGASVMALPWYATAAAATTGAAIGVIGGGCAGALTGAGFDLFFGSSK